jgi:hypothetical protein
MAALCSPPQLAHFRCVFLQSPTSQFGPEQRTHFLGLLHPFHRWPKPWYLVQRSTPDCINFLILYCLPSMVIFVSVMLFPVVQSLTLKMYNVVGRGPLVFLWIPSGSMVCPEGVLWFSKAVLISESCISRGILLMQYQGRRSLCAMWM